MPLTLPLGSPLVHPLGCPLGCPLGVDHEQIREVREIVDPQQAHSLNQDLPLAKGKDQFHALA